MSAAGDLFEEYKGQIVPRTFAAGYVALSYLVSLVGAASTLELINRRTARHGLLNQLLLLSSAVTMGGIAIWCMHFVGNRAIILGSGEVQLQIVYSPGFTALSFFIPIIVLLAAFVAVGANNRVSWWRIVVGGSLAGSAICGMHYLGNASIENYDCVYAPLNIFGAILIAVVASIVALALFFVFRASWTNSWWKRGVSAVVLGGAVSGMHWCASTGTNYRLTSLSQNHSNLHQDTSVIVVIVLSISAALIVAGLAAYSTHVMRRSAHKAQQVVLAAAVFDRRGRILVSPDGLLPSEKITDTYLEKTPSDIFSVAHPLFHWMFQASRNWNGLGSLIQGMKGHVNRLQKAGRDGKTRLVNESGQLVDSYDIILRELFCLAAANLAERFKEPLEHAGILWDEILPTGTGRSPRHHRPADIDELLQGSRPKTAPASRMNTAADLGENGDAWKLRQQEYGRGSLMFLVRRAERSQDVEKLEAAGYRFADVNQVAGIIGSSMQIKTRNLRGKLADMAAYAEENTMMEPGVHLGFFGVRARVGAIGFDVLAKKGARNLLPSIQLPLERLDAWQMDLIRQLDRTSVPTLLQKLDAMKKMLSPREMMFASQLSDALEALRAWIDDPLMDEATLTSKVVQVPCRPRTGSNSAQTCTMITLRLVIPIHASLNSPKCEFIPLNFFKVHQMVYKDSPQHAAFSRNAHREMSSAAPIIAIPATPTPPHGLGSRFKLGGILDRLRGRRSSSNQPVEVEGTPASAPFGGRKLSVNSESNKSGSTLKFWDSALDSSKDDREADLDRPAGPRIEMQQTSHFGGIMVSQEIKVDVREAIEPAARTRQAKPGMDRINIVRAEQRRQSLASDIGEHLHTGAGLGKAVVESGRGTEVSTFVDDLFAVCLDER